MHRFAIFTILLVCLGLPLTPARAAEPLVIASNGGGTGPFEHTLVGAALAVERGAEFLEIQVGLSKDNVPMGFSDLTLNRLTDVTALFPKRHRDDGGFYLADFSLAELRQLRLQPAFESGPDAPLLPMVSLEELLNLLHHLDKKRGKITGILIVLRSPAFYRGENKDLSGAVLDLLKEYPDLRTEGKLLISSSDSDELQRVHQLLESNPGQPIPLIQLLAHQEDAQLSVSGTDWILTNSGLRLVSTYASALGVQADPENVSATPVLNAPFREELKKHNLQLFIRVTHSNDSIAGQGNDESKLQSLLESTSPDGVVTDDFSVVSSHITSTVVDSTENRLPPFFSKLHLSPVRPGTQVPKNPDKKRELQ